MILLTHFDETYRAQGECMLRSLMQHSSEHFKICVLWLGDRDAFSGDHNIEVVNLHGFMNGDERLFKARENRSYRSFCWTLEPALVHSCLKAQPDDEIIVYCDADMLWFSDPIPTIRFIMEYADVALSPHHFPPGQEIRERIVGKYNFGCGVFRACDLTRRLVGEWLDQTLEKCDEFGAGDQKYLDQWPDKLGKLVELPEGFNVGPWRALEIFEVNELGNYFRGNDDKFHSLISYHYHEMRRGIGPNPVTIKGEQWNRTFYTLKESTIENVYKPYEAALSKFL